MKNKILTIITLISGSLHLTNAAVVTATTSYTSPTYSATTPMYGAASPMMTPGYGATPGAMHPMAATLMFKAQKKMMKGNFLKASMYAQQANMINASMSSTMGTNTMSMGGMGMNVNGISPMNTMSYPSASMYHPGGYMVTHTTTTTTTPGMTYSTMPLTTNYSQVSPAGAIGAAIGGAIGSAFSR